MRNVNRFVVSCVVVICLLACSHAPAADVNPQAAPGTMPVPARASHCDVSEHAAIEARQHEARTAADVRRALPPLWQGEAALLRIVALETALGDLETAVSQLSREHAKTKPAVMKEALERLSARLLEIRTDIASSRIIAADAFSGVEHAYVDAFGVPVQLGRGANAYDGACAEGDAQSCVRKAQLLETGVGVSKDVAAAAAAFARACSLGNAYACYREGALRQDGPPEVRDAVAAVQPLERACELGEGRGCALLARSWDVGRAGSADPARAAELYQRACVSEVTQACVALALQRLEGRGVARNFDQAKNLLELACDAGDAFGCSQLGELVFTGNGVAVDRARGATLFTRGCAGGDAWACKRLRETHAP